MSTIGFVMAAVIWFAYCNNATQSDRIKLIEAGYEAGINNGFTHQYLDELEQVSYWKHLFYRLIFRDPFKLYSSELLKYRVAA